MTNAKTTKRALLSSVIALLLCCAMLVGTTFAWFTDSASAAVNKIQAGTLDVALEMKDAQGNWVNAEGETLGWVATDGRAQDEIFWEPGCTYKLPTLKITNKGNLALQFKILINNISGDLELLDALEFTCTYAASREDWAADLEPIQGSDMVNFPYELPVYHDTEIEEAFPYITGTALPPYSEEAGYDQNVVYYTIKAHMKESAGNEYQGLTLSNVAITVVATQVTAENDSTDNTYDKDAEYPKIVTTAADFEAALDNPDVTEIIVASDITFDWGGNSYDNSNALKMQNKVISGATGNEVVTFKGYGSANTIKDVTISNINVVDETVGDSTTGWEHAYLEFENLTATDVNFVNAPQLNGTCTLTNCTFTGTADKYAAWINSGDITLKGCTFNGIRSLKIHEAYGSDVVSVVVDGCTFNTTGKPGVVIGDLDSTTTVTIQNSTFNNCAAGDQGMYIYESDTSVDTFNFTATGNTVNNG